MEPFPFYSKSPYFNTKQRDKEWTERLNRAVERTINELEAKHSELIREKTTIEPDGYLGVDRNTVGHIAVVGNPKTGKILKLGKEATSWTMETSEPHKL